MIQVLKAKLLSIPLAVCALAFSFAGGSAFAQEKPFKISGAGYAEFIPVIPGTSAEHFAIGHGTGLGDYYGEGSFTLDGFTSPTTANFHSTRPFVFYGEEQTLACDYGVVSPGEVTLMPSPVPGKFIAVFVAKFTAVPSLSTGQFKKIIGGSFTMIAVSEPFVPGVYSPTFYTWKGEGSFTYKKGK